MLMSAAALRDPLPTTVLAAGVRRHSREIDSAAYFCCLEAFQNAATIPLRPDQR